LFPVEQQTAEFCAISRYGAFVIVQEYAGNCQLFFVVCTSSWLGSISSCEKSIASSPLEGKQWIFFSWEEGSHLQVRSILRASFLLESNTRPDNRSCWHSLPLSCLQQRNLSVRFVFVFQAVRPEELRLTIAFVFGLFCTRFENLKNLQLSGSFA